MSANATLPTNALLKTLSSLAAAINDSRSLPRFEEAMKIFNRDWADKIDAPKALDRWEASEAACLRFILTRPQDRERYFATFGHLTYKRIKEMKQEKEEARKQWVKEEEEYKGGLFLDSN